MDDRVKLHDQLRERVTPFDPPAPGGTPPSTCPWPTTCPDSLARKTGSGSSLHIASRVELGVSTADQAAGATWKPSATAFSRTRSSRDSRPTSVTRRRASNTVDR